jgi:(1->4)-alpha-D-glucan 1-alpha-D-glucosylmutase
VNEVGGDPRRPTTLPKQFHDHNLERVARYRQAMLATTTHDTKRTEDVRARLNVLSEIPREWRNAVQRFSRLNKRWRREVDGEAAPTPKDEYLYYQSVLGIWPLQPPGSANREELIRRLQAYMEKAIHEAKQRTSWINPNPPYEEAVRDFVRQTLRDSPQNRFIAELQVFLERIADAGQYNALAQLVLKLLSPGVPDIYQGQELWDYSLVDPDNRRPVDFESRRRFMADLGSESWQTSQLTSRPLHDPRMKLLVTQRLLHLRRRAAHFWGVGDYVPLESSGLLADHVLAFGWRSAVSHQLELVAAVPRFMQKLIDAERASGLVKASSLCALPTSTWEGTFIVLPTGTNLPVKNVFTGQCTTLAEPALSAGVLLGEFPVGVLEICAS